MLLKNLTLMLLFGRLCNFNKDGISFFVAFSIWTIFSFKISWCYWKNLIILSMFEWTSLHPYSYRNGQKYIQWGDASFILNEVGFMVPTLGPHNIHLNCYPWTSLISGDLTAIQMEFIVGLNAHYS